MTTQERAAIQSFYYLLHAGVEGGEFQERYEQEDIGRIIELLDETRRAALLEIRQFCVDYEDCCVLSLVAHANKAVTDASISTMQFIKRHIDDRLAQEG